MMAKKPPTTKAGTPRKRAPGGGRKPLDPNDPTRREQITMPESYWAKAKQVGDGNTSRGIRRALDNIKD